MNHFASLVPNHEYGCSAHCNCLCFRELSFLIISAICKKIRSQMKLLALHCNPRFVFCGGHFLTLHNNGTKIEMDYEQSYAPQLLVSKAFLVVVWLSYLQTRPSHQRYPRPPCLQGSTGSRLFSMPFVGISSPYRLKPGRLKGSHPMDSH